MQQLLLGAAAGGLLGHLYGHYLSGERASLPYAGAGALVGGLALALFARKREAPGGYYVGDGDDAGGGTCPPWQQWDYQFGGCVAIPPACAPGQYGPDASNTCWESCPDGFYLDQSQPVWQCSPVPGGPYDPALAQATPPPPPPPPITHPAQLTPRQPLPGPAIRSAPSKSAAGKHPAPRLHSASGWSYY